MPLLHKDFISVILLSTFIAINQLYLIPNEVISYGSSGTFPYLLNGMLIILTTFYFIETLRRKRLKIDGKAKFAFNISEGKAIALLAILWIWAESIESAGFIISTMFLLAGTAYLYGERSFIKICRLSIIAPLLSYVFFTLLKSTLPAGYLETWLLNMIR